MKIDFNRAFFSLVLALFFTASLAAKSEFRIQKSEFDEDSTGLAGDHFSLEAALELFKNAASPEDFEQKLNAKDNAANNLDLNEDGETDYIRLVDKTENDVHSLVLQAVLGENESQDVAVIEIEKQGAEEAILQIVGDEDIFGEQTLVEPFEEEAVKKQGRGGPAAVGVPFVRIVVNVWLWPSVRFMYAPVYRPWISPWRWRVYPGGWSPWRPHPFRVFHARVVPFHRHFRVATTHRVTRAHGIYAPHRTHSAVVHTKTTTVVKNRNGKTVGKKTTTSTTVHGKKGDVKKSKTTVEGPRGNSKTTKKTKVKKH